jgi:uncharacterized protein YggE
MKNATLFVLGLLLMCNQASSQSTDRFIRIVGNASHTFEADGRIFEISVSEVTGNEYRKVSPMPFEEVYSLFISHLDKIGIPENALVRTDKSTSKAYSTSNRSYSLTLNDKAKIEALQQMLLNGVGVNAGLYTYPPADVMIESQLTTDAIDDAKRKADSISKEVGMRVGKILNIEDTSAGCCSQIKDSREPVTTVTYHVNVTFELKDK